MQWRNTLMAFGRDVVTAGTCIVPVAVELGDTFTAEYGNLGRLSVQLI